MATCLMPSTQEIRETFVDEVSDLGGEVRDIFEEGQTLFIRSTFPRTKNVRPKDGVNPGAALRATAYDVMIHPYVFRQVCRNGAISAQVSDTCQIQRVDDDAPQEEIYRVLEDVRLAVRASADGQAFQDSVRAMRHATTIPGQIELLISIASLFPDSMHKQEMVRMLLQTYYEEGDQTQFGIVNAITAVARQTRDQETRWRLEEAGGGVLAALLPHLTPLGPAVAECC